MESCLTQQLQLKAVIISHIRIKPSFKVFFVQFLIVPIFKVLDLLPWRDENLANNMDHTVFGNAIRNSNIVETIDPNLDKQTETEKIDA
jgi:hypothetical protein